MSSVDEKKPKYWRSLGELEGDPEFQEFVEREFATPLEGDAPDSAGRRRFLQLMGASFALAGCRWEKDHMVAHSRRPEGHIPGKPKHYTTVMDLGAVGYALTVKSFDGRPIKVEGNANQPHSKGATTVFAQASVLEMYDPDRSQGVAQYGGGSRAESDWKAFEAEGRKLFDAAKSAGGAALRFLSAASSSPALNEVKKRLRTAFPQAKWYEYEAASRDNERTGSKLAFGAPKRMHLSLDKAQTIVSLDADLFARHPAATKHAADFVARRSPEAGSMSRLYAIESEYTTTGAMSDHRLPLRSSYVKAFAAALDAAVSAKVPDGSGAQPRPKAAFLDDAKVKKLFDAVVSDLLAARGRSVVVAGSRQPAEVHALAHRLNSLLGNVNQTVKYTPEPDQNRPAHAEAIKTLTAELNSGSVETIVVLGGNPVFDAPSDVEFAAAYGKVKNRIRLGLFEDETSRASTWHLPQAHFLEVWNDARSYDGTLSIAQPLMAPLFAGRSNLELLAFILNEEKQAGIDILRETHRGWAADDRAWRRAVHDGVVAGTRWGASATKLETLDPITFKPEELGGLDAKNGSLELVLIPSPAIHDGRFANNGWLQELPDMFTKLTWDNAALMSPGTAKALGVGDGTLVKLSVGGKELTVPALMSPGIAQGSVVLAYGYGRTAAGRVGGSKDQAVDPVGANAYVLRTTERMGFGAGLSVQPTGTKTLLATTQDKHAIDQLGKKGTNERLPNLIREQTLPEYTKRPDAVRHQVHHPPLLSLWQEPVSYDGRKWGMSVDLNKCVGCNACITACQAENNVPVVGKDKVARGKEMHWIRIDRYFKGDPDDPEMTHQMVTCHHCEHAPCEQVCPVGATTHSDEGLNDMVYNRCIGTRYCSNNCPYKVRRFNYHNYHESTGPFGQDNPLNKKENQLKAMAFNPEVSVRFRGVMEKCTFCVQRIKAVTVYANNTRRKVKDGEIKTACQETCPSGAIVFGDLNDGNAQVRDLQHRPRSYPLLEELNIRPRLKYLARVRNPNPTLNGGGNAGHGTEGH